MVSEMLRPTVVDFLDSMLRSSQGHLRIHQLVITGHSSVAGKSIAESGLQKKIRLLVLGLKLPAQDIEINPPATKILKPGMTLIVMGDVDDIATAKKAFSEASH